MFSEKSVYEHLKKLGVPANLSGYNGIMHAILLVGTSDKHLSMTKELYPQIGETIGSTGPKVERCIRHAVARVFEQTDPDVLYEYFGNTYTASRGKPTNSEFIYGVVEYIRQCES